MLESQCIRMISSGDKKSLGNLDFWLGDLMVGIVPWMGHARYEGCGHTRVFWPYWTGKAGQ